LKKGGVTKKKEGEFYQLWRGRRRIWGGGYLLKQIWGGWGNILCLSTAGPHGGGRGGVWGGRDTGKALSSRRTHEVLQKVDRIMPRVGDGKGKELSPERKE